MIHVAVGIIRKPQGEVLIAQRLPHKYGGNLWEFPGGKVEENETVYEALKREFQEEVGVHVNEAQAWLQIKHDYADRIVFLDTWLITDYTGEPYGAENQEVRWVFPNQFQQFKFPDGNKLILEKLIGEFK